jgi:dienelactone hydrolase
LNDEQPTPERVEAGYWMGTTAIGDLVCAIRTASADAEQFGGRSDQLVLVGYSLGGPLTATVALAGNAPAAGTSGTCTGPEVSIEPKAFVGLDAPYDFVDFALREDPSLSGTDPEDAPDPIRRLSPLTHVQSVPEPPLSVHLVGGGTWDRHIEPFREVLEEAGYPVAVSMFPGSDHGWFEKPDELPGVVDIIVDAAYG